MLFSHRVFLRVSAISVRLFCESRSFTFSVDSIRKTLGSVLVWRDAILDRTYSEFFARLSTPMETTGASSALPVSLYMIIGCKKQCNTRQTYANVSSDSFSEIMLSIPSVRYTPGYLRVNFIATRPVMRDKLGSS